VLEKLGDPSVAVVGKREPPSKAIESL
jgi:hypothetical protein